MTIAPSWFDPSTAPPQITPFGILYALHDALVRPLPGQKVGNSLAESWTESPDGLVYEFRLRRGARFVRITSAGLHESHVHDVIITKEAPNYRR